MTEIGISFISCKYAVLKKKELISWFFHVLSTSINNAKFKLGKFNPTTADFIVFDELSNKANSFLISYDFKMSAK